MRLNPRSARLIRLGVVLRQWSQTRRQSTHYGGCHFGAEALLGVAGVDGDTTCVPGAARARHLWDEDVPTHEGPLPWSICHAPSTR